MDHSQILSQIQQVRVNMQKAMVGKESAVNLLIIALLSNGHALLEDVPGIGKTTMVHALSRSLDCSFARIQFTPDVMPSDITGLSVYNMKTQEFEFRAGPIFHQIILADEINRTSPKTQSSLLEIMQEHQVTVDGITYKPPMPFMVLATQNPIEHAGTFPLPDAQLDRFCLSVRMGYPTVDQEVTIMSRVEQNPDTAYLTPVIDSQMILELQEASKNVTCSDKIKNYIAKIAYATRNHPDFKLGISPRASIHLMQTSKSYALLDGRDYVVPQDIKQMLLPVLSHRLILRSASHAADKTLESVLKDLLRSLPVPK
jgi:MoxR-like ATPase